jgi:Tfp pilus assembly protein PilN
MSAGQRPASRQRRGLTIVLAVAAVAFLIAAGALGALYLAERTAHDRTQEQVTTHQTHIDGLQKELDSTKGKLTSAEQATREQESRNAEPQKCADAAGEFFAALEANDEDRGKQAVTVMLSAC